MAHIRHTMSTDRRTHALTVDDVVTIIRYKTAPKFTDQVQGDLVRKYWAEGGEVSPIGRIINSPTVDPKLDN